ncbi:transmembrane protein 167 precursor [Ophiostoma piceae UAMH 11346]|uniref:Transmembrane protein 167 n=1 Tax=Ophiostoma piceae (strain UAMH 11346) TaxID=1262450 RepID=S3BWJ7_OPHP1|nr:transmembrane protein 167 precursor [Ophiostoma piceae UAMH 11346]
MSLELMSLGNVDYAIALESAANSGQALFWAEHGRRAPPILSLASPASQSQAAVAELAQEQPKGNRQEAKGNSANVFKITTSTSFNDTLCAEQPPSCTYVHQMFPTLLDNRKQGVMGIFWKSARIGERLSPYISLCCVFMAFSVFVGN